VVSFKEALIHRTALFSAQVDSLEFSFEGFIYNPLDYAWAMHSAYLLRYINEGVKVFFLGMNPGPFGMAQTGVPFGDVEMVTEWFKLAKEIGKPPREHPKRPILGLQCKRREVSGTRLWSLMGERFGSAEAFFAQHAVMNYCPLVFVDKGEGGRNIVPQKLKKGERDALETVCDAYLDDVLRLIKPRYLVGIGQYAKEKLLGSKRRLGLPNGVFSVLHPSPSSPLANQGWSELATRQLEEEGIW